MSKLDFPRRKAGLYRNVDDLMGAIARKINPARKVTKPLAPKKTKPIKPKRRKT